MARAVVAAALCAAVASAGPTVCTGSVSVAPITFEPINGSAAVSFGSQYNGSVVLFLNVASFWGETVPYYTGLAQVATQFAGQPFAILGQPCNQFGGQEPGEGEYEIRQCVEQVRPGHGYTIPSIMALTAKGDVNGILATPLATQLKKSCGGGDVGWNFEAWTISKSGLPYKRYATGVGPLNMVADIQALLARDW